MSRSNTQPSTATDSPPAQSHAHQSTKTSSGTHPGTAEGAGILPHLRRFFDPNGDGRISLKETYDGLRRLDLGRLFSVWTALGINLSLGALTLSNPLALPLSRMKTFRHGGDSGVVDDHGKFHEERLDALFAKHARKYGDALTLHEVLSLRRDNLRRNRRWLTLPVDEVATLGDWLLLFYVADEKRDGQRVLTKQTVEDFYTRDDLFTKLAHKNQQARQARRRTLLGRIENVFHTWVL